MSIEKILLPFGECDLEIETGRLAKQSHGSILASVGGTTALVTVTHSDQPKEGGDFFPLMVDYREKFYASGRMPGGFFRREGRPGDPETLKARVIDRAIRPLFPEGMRHEVMVYVTVISSDNENPVEVAAMCATSLALQISDVPFPVPMAGVRVGYMDGEYILNPTYAEIEECSLDILMAGTKTAINMVEAGATEVSEEIILGALEYGHEAIVELIEKMEPFVQAAGRAKFDPKIPVVPDDVKGKITALAAPQFKEMVHAGLSKSDYSAREHEIAREVAKEFKESHADLGGPIAEFIEGVHSEEVRKLICTEHKRVDGRAFDEIRPIACEVGVLARTHGSALFTRGQTQALGVVTLGTLDDAQKIDNMLGISEKKFMLHYNFPPWSVGEARPMRAAGRREIGHGALAERALEAIMPSPEEFPYTVRVVSEILESNGSSSMASACVGCLAMMDAGIPIKKPVAGIAMGLATHGGDYAILTDIQGVEDHLGDMDFKVTGTRDGVTALQMDIKVESVSHEILARALEQARKARMFILDKMTEVMPAPRAELSPNAPRLTILKIPVDKIGAVIGPGGKVIRGIIERTGVKIDVQDDGTVYIASTEGAAAKAAEEEVRGLTAEVELNRTYTGKVVRITDFGAFVQLLPGKDGLVHISEMDDQRVEQVEDVCKLGDEMTVKVISIDPMGKVRLSRRAVLAEAEGREYEPSQRPSGGGGRGGPRDRGDRGDRDRGPRRDRGDRYGGERHRDRDRDREGGHRSSFGFRERERSKD